MPPKPSSRSGKKLASRSAKPTSCGPRSALASTDASGLNLENSRQLRSGAHQDVRLPIPEHTTPVNQMDEGEPCTEEETGNLGASNEPKDGEGGGEGEAHQSMVSVFALILLLLVIYL